MKFVIHSRSFFALSLMMLLACSSPTPKEPALIIRENPKEAAAKAIEIRENTPVQLAEGFTLSLWASDSLAPDPIAMSIDDKGRVYLTRTNRQKHSEFDIRGYRDWMIPSIGFQTVEDRRAFLHSTFAPEKSKGNEWLTDLNGDGSHDWHDLAVEKEEVWRLEDKSGDGIADISTRILNDFNDEVTDVAGALLVREEDVFVGVGPDMWRLKDTDGDGLLDHKESISHGYAVHIGFSGHGMSGAIEGPDGKIYWGIGDIGFNGKDKAGKTYEHPNEGVIVRSNPDGSDFEVFAAGLRNTHEFVFDEYGNIISSDNDGDHAGESERLVYIVDGHDAGWRSNWQYGKYVDPKNNSYKVWMDEELYKPRWEGQAAYIIPPIVNYHNGPTGMAYNPGTALGSAWRNSFFLVEFVGNPSRSHIWSFKLKPKGASFELASEVDVLSGILPTGIKFGPDGALYVADWINGWDAKNYGRVWRLDVTTDKNDLKAERAETKRLIQLDYQSQPNKALLKMLNYGDMRVRKKAQFELVKRNKDGFKILQEATVQTENQLARVHGIWGIGQLAREDKEYAKALTVLLTDGDPEIVAQAAKVVGDLNYADATDQLIPLLKAENLRVQFFAAQALGRFEAKSAVPALITMLQTNNDRDVYVRHAGVLALARIGEVKPIAALATNSSRALRIAAVLVLRRLHDENVALFLKDADEYIVTEAARAINDDRSIEKALPALAATLANPAFTSEPLVRRAISACLRVGGEKEMDYLIDFVDRTNAPAALRAEALATLATWPNPSTLDRVDGRLRGVVKHDAVPLIAKVKPHIPAYLASRDNAIVEATANMIATLQLSDFNPQLESLLVKSKSADVRASMLVALHAVKFDKMPAMVKVGMEDKDEKVRAEAIGMLTELDLTRENLPTIVTPIFKNGTSSEQQRLLHVLGEMPVEKTEPVLMGLIDQLKMKRLDPAIVLDLEEAIDSTKNAALLAQLAPVRVKGSSVDAFQDVLYGGDTRRGRSIFMNNSTAQCVRCHAIGGGGGTVGPDLSHIASTLTREQLLRALVDPSARLAPGYGSVTVTLSDGQVVNGILMEEHAKEIILKTADAEPLRIPLSRISKRENMSSGMPPMGSMLSKRELRDVIAFLVSLKNQDGVTSGHGKTK